MYIFHEGDVYLLLSKSNSQVHRHHTSYHVKLNVSSYNKTEIFHATN
ncbi:MAG: hypothetical protein WCG25_06520 [bacterium]